MATATDHEPHRRPYLTSSDVPQTDERPSPSPGAEDAPGDGASPTEEGRQDEFPGLAADEKQQQPPTKDEEPPPKLHRTLRFLAIIGLLINAAIWGTLTREGLIALNTYDGRSIQPVIWAQAVGCLVM